MEPTTLSFEDFWQWLLEHHNCILRAGTPETILYDEEEFHWNLTGNEAGNRVVQVVWGKAIAGGTGGGARSGDLRGGGAG